jgi:predicted MPP superfamily phosphohydrolase
MDRITFSEIPSTEWVNEILRDGNIVVLEDEVLLLRENFFIAGRKDAMTRGRNVQRKSAMQLLEGIDRDSTVRVLSHQATQFAELEEAGADLLFCGHTHGGGFFPLSAIARAVSKRTGRTHYGYWKGETMQAVVTSGAGNWVGPQLRILTNNEVAVINVSFTNSY